MLTAIRVGNFKAFGESQRIPIKPLTFIYGANSSGKSSVLHSLLLARHIQETGDLDVYRTTIGGESVDLGGFKQYIHQRNKESDISLEWEISGKDLTKRLNELLINVDKIKVGITIGFFNDLLSFPKELLSATPKDILFAFLKDAQKKKDEIEIKKFESAIENAEELLSVEEVFKLKSKLNVKSFSITIDSQLFLSASIRSDKVMQLDILDHDHKVLQFLIRTLVQFYSSSDKVKSKEIEYLKKHVDTLIPEISFRVKNLFPFEIIPNEIIQKRDETKNFITVKNETRKEDLKQVINANLPGIIEEIIRELKEMVEKECLNRISYLGPLRYYPPRHIDINTQYDSGKIAGGAEIWEILKRNREIREKINKWLGDGSKFSTPYELQMKYLLTINSIKNKFEALFNRASQEYYKNMLEDDYNEAQEEFETAINNIPDHLEKLSPDLSDMSELILFDKNKKTTVSHRDVGIGISQVLPVLVTCFSSKNKIIAMEQPEIHLHPALQAELGDVFIESAIKDQKNTLIVESHSEHILLRIMRRMRQTYNNELPEGVPPVRPEDVCVLFVEPVGSHSIVREMPLNERGDLVKAWPGGFFEEGLREIF
jgi:AAA15 family ATPase/GTPase